MPAVTKNKIQQNFLKKHCQSLTLIHGIDNKGNSHGQQNHTVNLRKGVLVFGKGKDGDRSPSQHHRQVHPSQKGTLVGKEHLWFDFYGCLSRFDHVISFRSFLLGVPSTKNLGEDTAFSVANWRTTWTGNMIGSALAVFLTEKGKNERDSRVRYTNNKSFRREMATIICLYCGTTRVPQST